MICEVVRKEFFVAKKKKPSLHQFCKRQYKPGDLPFFDLTVPVVPTGTINYQARLRDADNDDNMECNS